MLPSLYACTSCGHTFPFAHREASYYLAVDGVPLGQQVSGARLFQVPVRPGWCKDCGDVCLVEDIAPLRAFEDALGAVRSGRAVEYPTQTENLTPELAREEVEAFLRWRMDRRHAPRALCCGGLNYQLLDVPQPLLKHAECDFGVVEAQYFFPGSYCGPGPGVLAPANIPIFGAEGERLGTMTWVDRETGIWQVTPAAYPVQE